MKKILLVVSILTSAFVSTLASGQAFAANQLTCKVSEDVKAPLQVRSHSYVVTAPLIKSQTRVDLGSSNFDLKIGIETFLSTLTSPGQQVVLINIHDNKTDRNFTADGHGMASANYDLENGVLVVQCSVN